MKLLTLALLLTALHSAQAANLPPPPPGLPPLMLPGNLPLPPAGKATREAPAAGGFQLHFDRIALVDLLAICYSDVLKRGYALDAAIASRTETVSVNFTSKTTGAVYPVLEALIDGIGGEIVHKGGIDLIRPLKTDKTAWEALIYKPKARSVGYLTAAMAGQFTGQFSGQGGGESTASPKATEKGKEPAPAAPTGNAKADVLVFYGSIKEQGKVKELLTQLDTAEDDLVISANIYEVSGLTDKETALGLVVKAANGLGKASLSIGAQSAGANSVSLGYAGISVIASLADTDARFKLVSSPVMRAKSGESANITLGDTVSIITSTVLDKNGNPLQNREQKQSGLNFTATPTARGETVELNVNLSLSDATGTAEAPRFLNRSITGSYGAAYGEAVTIGGLRQEKTTASASRLFGWSTSNASTSAHTEFLVVITTEHAKR